MQRRLERRHRWQYPSRPFRLALAVHRLPVYRHPHFGFREGSAYCLVLLSGRLSRLAAKLQSGKAVELHGLKGADARDRTGGVQLMARFVWSLRLCLLRRCGCSRAASLRVSGRYENECACATRGFRGTADTFSAEKCPAAPGARPTARVRRIRRLHCCCCAFL